jgi:tetratricopeptide (TPR) repeat protein
MMRLDFLRMKLWAMALLVLGRNEAALGVFNAMAARWPQDPYPLASRAHLLTQKRQLDAALLDSARLVVLRPQHAPTWFNHGFMLEEAGRLDDALLAFSKATALDEKLDRAWYGQGLVLIRLKRYDDAVSALKRNTELQPMSPYAWYQLARVHVDRQEPGEAVKIIKHLRGFEPKVAAQLERETGLLASGPFR